MKSAMDRRQFGIGGLAAGAAIGAGALPAGSGALAQSGAVPPFSLDPDLRAIAHTLFTQHDAFGVTQLTMWTARENFIQKNHAALVDFLEDTVRAIRWYIDPKNHDEAVAIVARLNKAPPARMDWAFTSRDQYRDPNGTPNLSALQNNLKQQKDVGFLRDDLDVQKYADLSMVGEAVKRLG